MINWLFNESFQLWFKSISAVKKITVSKSREPNPLLIFYVFASSAAQLFSFSDRTCRNLLEPARTWQNLLEPAGTCWNLLEPDRTCCWTSDVWKGDPAAGSARRLQEVLAGSCPSGVSSPSSLAIASINRRNFPSSAGWVTDALIGCVSAAPPGKRLLTSITQRLANTASDSCRATTTLAWWGVFFTFFFFLRFISQQLFPKYQHYYVFLFFKMFDSFSLFAHMSQRVTTGSTPEGPATVLEKPACCQKS